MIYMRLNMMKLDTIKIILPKGIFVILACKNDHFWYFSHQFLYEIMPRMKAEISIWDNIYRCVITKCDSSIIWMLYCQIGCFIFRFFFQIMMLIKSNNLWYAQTPEKKFQQNPSTFYSPPAAMFLRRWADYIKKIFFWILGQY